jgi:hypothetical protein
MKRSIIFISVLFFAHNIYGQSSAPLQEAFEFDTNHIVISGTECKIGGDVSSNYGGRSHTNEPTTINGPLHDSPCELLYNVSLNTVSSPSDNTQGNAQTLTSAEAAVATNN